MFNMLSVANKLFMLSVVILNAVMLSVSVPTNTLAYYDIAPITVIKSFIAPAPIYNLQFLIEAKKKVPRHSA
jgi:hypothetical protein